MNPTKTLMMMGECLCSKNAKGESGYYRCWRLTRSTSLSDTRGSVSGLLWNNIVSYN